MQDVTIKPLPIDWLGAGIGSDRLTGVRRSLMRLRRLLGDRTVWTVNSTATGGGVAEMLPRVLGYQWAAGIRAPWMVIGGDEAFFALTKRLHQCLHGSSGDGGPLGPADTGTTATSSPPTPRRFSAAFAPATSPSSTIRRSPPSPARFGRPG